MGRVLKNGHEAASREAEVLELLWGWRSCDRCGETLILGEEIVHLRRDGSSEQICLACAEAPRTAGSKAPVNAFRYCPPLETREACDAA